MLMTLSSPVMLALLLSGITYAITQLYLRFGHKLYATKGPEALQMAANNAMGNLSNRPAYDPVHIPVEIPTLQLEPFDEESENWELIEDDNSILLKEAESVIEQIGSIIENIASDPPNPSEVYTKIKSVVSQYKIFQDTDFYDAINRFIVISIDRDFKLSFTEAELQEMWN
jgi:hypothetical protein